MALGHGARRSTMVDRRASDGMGSDADVLARLILAAAARCATGQVVVTQSDESVQEGVRSSVSGDGALLLRLCNALRISWVELGRILAAWTGEGGLLKVTSPRCAATLLVEVGDEMISLTVIDRKAGSDEHTEGLIYDL